MTQITSGPYIYSLGEWDTLANLTAAYAAGNVQPSTVALCQDVGWVYSDGTSWKSFSAGSASQLQLLTSGSTGTMASDTKTVMFNGVATTFTLTLRAPTGQGDRIELNATQAVSVGLTLTVASPATVIKNAPATLAAGVGAAWIYNVSDTTWYRVY